MKNKSFFKRFTIAIFLFKFSPIAFSTDTLHQGKNLTNGKKLVSSNGVFELGFFNTSSSTKSFAGIWFTYTPDIVVWVANRDHPLNGTSSTLTVDDNGSLLLYDAYNQKITWLSTGINYGKGAVTLQLQNSGNLILNDLTTNTVIWQSFDYPTNTLLPGMKLGKNLITGIETYLSSWKSADDPSTGQYSYRMDTKGAPEIIMRDRDQIYYRSGMWNGLYFSGEPIMKAYTDKFTFLFVWNQSAVSYGYMVNLNSLFSRIVLNEFGFKERLDLDQSHHTRWNIEFLKAPNGNCDYYGACGPFGVCQPDGMTTCNCLPGFEPAEPTEWEMGNISGGCTRIKPLGCSSKSDEFYEFKEVKLPYSHDAIVDANISVKECKHRCLMDCSCQAYAPFDISKESGCVMWNSTLIDMRYVKDPISSCEDFKI